jgi:predicted acetyltransferase
MEMQIEIIPAKIEQKPIVANLLELYAYDFTEFFDFDIGDSGFYGYEWLPLYWSDPNRFPYLVYVDGKLAGLVVIQKGSPITDDREIYDVAEFFIMRKYKRKKIGSSVAFKIWEMFKGHWQVRVLVENKIACSFWSNTVKNLQVKKCLEQKRR